MTFLWKRVVENKVLRFVKTAKFFTRSKEHSFQAANRIVKCILSPNHDGRFFLYKLIICYLLNILFLFITAYFFMELFALFSFDPMSELATSNPDENPTHQLTTPFPRTILCNFVSLHPNGTFYLANYICYMTFRDYYSVQCICFIYLSMFISVVALQEFIFYLPKKVLEFKKNFAKDLKLTLNQILTLMFVIQAADHGVSNCIMDVLEGEPLNR